MGENIVDIQKYVFSINAVTTRTYLVFEMLDRLLQGQDLVEERALKHWFEQAELLLRRHLPPLF